MHVNGNIWSSPASSPTAPKSRQITFHPLTCRSSWRWHQPNPSVSWVSQRSQHMTLREIVATNLRRLRHAKRLSQEEFADRLGINSNYVGMLEREQHSATADMLKPRSLRPTPSNSSVAKREQLLSPGLRFRRPLLPSLRRRGTDKLRRFDLKRLRDLPEHRHARRDVGAFDPSDISGAQPGSLGQFLLRHSFRMTQPTQIDRHDLLEIHGDDGADIGTIVPGTIVPIRTWWC
jgi:DNA-binding XRE family transcriptional regulator